MSDKKIKLQDLQKKLGVIGRLEEAQNIIHCLNTNKHILLEGPVGVGKTFLVLAITKFLHKNVVRIDGDARYTEQKLTGWFDPPTVLKKGYGKASYFDGPLIKAMKAGAVLFINELNRMPEGVQNILLPTMDEGHIEIPRIGTVKAKPGFTIIATQNPKEFVATTHISEALLDRFELIHLSYQSYAEEKEILKLRSTYKQHKNDSLLEWCLQTINYTRESTLFQRGASIRAAISLYDIAQSNGGDWDAFEKACHLALPNRVELSDEGIELGAQRVIQNIIDDLKKKSSPS